MTKDDIYTPHPDLVVPPGLLDVLKQQQTPRPSPSGSASKSTKEPEVDYPWYEDIYEYMTGSREGERLTEEYGAQVMEGAPGDIRMDVGAVTGHRDKTIRAMNLLGALSGTKFKLDPDSKRLMYQKTDDSGFTMVDPPGMEGGDWAEMLGSDAATLIGEGAGLAVTRGRKGSRAFWPKAKRAIFGIFGGAAAGEAAKELNNIQRGVYEHLREDSGEFKTGKLYDKLVLEPGKAGSLALAGAGAARLLSGAYKGAKGYLTGKNIPGSFIERGLALPNEAPEAIRAINQFLKESGSDKVFNPDSARTLNDPELMAALDRFARERGLEGNEAVRKLYEANYGALEEAVEAAGEKELAGSAAALGISPEPGAKELAGSAAALETERVLSRQLEGQARQAESAMGSRVDEATEQARQAVGTVEEGAGLAARSPDLGQSIRAVPEGEVSALQTWADEIYGPIVKEADNKRFYHTNLYDEALSQKVKYDADLAKTLTEENRRLVDDIVGALDEIRARPRGPFTSSFEQHNRLISQLKKAERQIDQGLLPGLDKNSLASLRKSAMADRERHLMEFDAKNGTDLWPRLQEADRLYKIEKDKHAGGVLKDLLTFNPATRRMKIADPDVFSKIFGRDAQGTVQRATDFAAVLKQNGTKYIDEWEAIKGGIFRKYIDENAVDGFIDPAKSAKWIESHKGSLEAYLDPLEIGILGRSTQAAEAMVALEKRQIDFSKALKKSRLGKVVGKESKVDYFSEFWRNPKTLEDARRILEKNHPHAWQMFKAQAIEQVKTDLRAHTPKSLYDIMGDVVTYEGLTKILTGPYRKKLTSLFGEEYVKNLDMLRKGASILGRSPGKVKTDQVNKFVELIRNVAFGPLSHRNFAIKKLGLARIGVQMHNLENVLLDPELLNAAARSMHTSEGMKSFQTLIGSAIAMEETQPVVPLAPENLREDKGIEELRNKILKDKRLQQKVTNALSQ